MNTAQELQLKRLKLTSFNNLDGERVARDLVEHENLWLSFAFGRFGFQPLIELRDLPSGIINADELFIMMKRHHVAQLLDVIGQWKADEVGWQTGNEHGGDYVGKSAFDLIGAPLGPDYALIRVWWD